MVPMTIDEEPKLMGKHDVVDQEDHMRIHGSKNEPITDQEESQPPAVAGGNSAARSPSYKIRANVPSHHRTTCICDDCTSRDFLSRNSNFEHGSSSSVAVVAASDGSDDDDNRDGLCPPLLPRSWYKGKRTKRDGEPCSSTDDDLPPDQSRKQEEDLARCLIMLSNGGVKHAPVPNQNLPAPRGKFPCKDCNRVFKSHQALGGHRASHKGVKGCSAKGSRIEDHNNNVNNQNNMVRSSSRNMTLSIVPFAENSSQPLPPRNPKPHICPICDKEFFTGQALGGHMRFHRKATAAGTADVAAATATAATEPTMDAAPTDVEVNASSSGVNAIEPRSPKTLPLLFNNSYPTIDLNIPAEPIDDFNGSPLRLGLPDAKSPQPGWDKRKKHRVAAAMSDNDNEKERVKVVDLGDLNNMDGTDESSPWLQK